MTPVRLEPEAPRSPVKHSTTDQRRSLYVCLVCIILKCFQGFKGKSRPRKCIVDIENYGCSLYMSHIGVLSVVG